MNSRSRSNRPRSQRSRLQRSRSRSNGPRSHRSRLQRSRSTSNKEKKLFSKPIDIDLTRKPGNQLRNIMYIYDESYKAWNNNWDKYIGKWSNWLIPIRDTNYTTLNCPYGEFLKWTYYQIDNNNLLNKYNKDFLKQLFFTLEEEAFTGIYTIEKYNAKLYESLTNSHKKREIFMGPTAERAKFKNMATLSNSQILLFLNFKSEKKLIY
tara:strand:+ start:1171 stop:1794 length:624 start_codon:yes stop_codon:yes gene_type:complete